VNPTQFGPKEDFSRYPRPFAADRDLCARLGVDVLFHPDATAIYPAGFSTYVQEEEVGMGLCGASRPGHFRGVCTVVLKLLLLTRATHAVFGRKDFQQCAVIARLVRDLNLPVKLDFIDTMREPDGLALSSRNAYLAPEERKEAPRIYAALVAAQAAVAHGESFAPRLRTASFFSWLWVRGITITVR
jgi:pantoate--beta-alanine ligase